MHHPIPTLHKEVAEEPKGFWMTCCDKHIAHVEHFERLDKRVGDLEERDFEKTQLIA